MIEYGSSGRLMKEGIDMEDYGIAAYRSRTQVLRLEALLKRPEVDSDVLAHLEQLVSQAKEMK